MPNKEYFRDYYKNNRERMMAYSRLYQERKRRDKRELEKKRNDDLLQELLDLQSALRAEKNNQGSI